MFYFTLASDLGMTVDQLLSSLSSYELAEWAAYYQIRHEAQKKAEEEAEEKAKRNSS